MSQWSPKTKEKLETAVQDDPAGRGFVPAKILIRAAVIGLLLAVGVPWLASSHTKLRTQSRLEAQAKSDEATNDQAVETNNQSTATPVCAERAEPVFTWARSRCARKPVFA